MERSNIYYHVWLLFKDRKFQKVLKEVPVEFCKEGDASVMLSKLDNYIFEAFKDIPELHSYGYISNNFNHILVCINGKKNTSTKNFKDFRYFVYDMFKPYSHYDMFSMITVPNQKGEYVETIQDFTLTTSQTALKFFIELYNQISDYYETLKNYITGKGYIYHESNEYVTLRNMLKYFVMLNGNMDISIFKHGKDYSFIENIKSEFDKAKNNFINLVNKNADTLITSTKDKISANKFFLSIYDYLHSEDFETFKIDELKNEILNLLETATEININKNLELIEIIKNKESKNISQNNKQNNSSIQDFDESYDSNKLKKSVDVNPRTPKYAAKMVVTESELNELFDKFNELVFDNKCDKVPVVYDLIKANVYGLNKSRVLRESVNEYKTICEWIKITCKYELSKEEIYSVLLHEMIHNYMSVNEPYYYLHDSHGFKFQKWCDVCYQKTGIKVTPKQSVVINLKKTTDKKQNAVNPVIITYSFVKGKKYYLIAKTSEKYLTSLILKIEAINTLYKSGKMSKPFPGGYLMTDKFNSLTTVRTLGTFNIISEEVYEELKKDKTFISFED